MGAHDAYQAVRGVLVTLMGVARAVEDRYGRDVCNELLEDYELKLLGYTVFLDRSCDRCGTLLFDDCLGVEAYQLYRYEHVCQSCFNALSTTAIEPRRRYARLAVFAAEQPELVATVLVQAQRERDLNDKDMEDLLDIDRLGFLGLAMSPLPTRATYTDDITRLAKDLGCSAVALRTLMDEYCANNETIVI